MTQIEKPSLQSTQRKYEIPSEQFYKHIANRRQSETLGQKRVWLVLFMQEQREHYALPQWM